MLLVMLCVPLIFMDFFKPVWKTLGYRFLKTLIESQSIHLCVPSPEVVTESSHWPGPGAGDILGRMRQMISVHQETKEAGKGVS